MLKFVTPSSKSSSQNRQMGISKPKRTVQLGGWKNNMIYLADRNIEVGRNRKVAPAHVALPIACTAIRHRRSSEPWVSSGPSGKLNGYGLRGNGGTQFVVGCSKCMIALNRRVANRLNMDEIGVWMMEQQVCPALQRKIAYCA